MSSYLLLLFIIPALVSLILILCARRRNHNQSRSTPEPSGGWPVIGHLHLLASQIPVHRVLGALADEYGPIFTIRLGVRRSLVISSWELVKECFTINDKILAKRPESSHGVYLGYNYAGFGFTHGPYWRDVRRLVQQEMLSLPRLEKMRHVRESEVGMSIEELHRESKGGNVVVVISQWIEKLTLNIIMRMINGGRCRDEGSRPVREAVKEFMYLSGQFVVSDIIPILPLRWMDLGGHIKSMKRISEELSRISEKWIDEHEERRRQLGSIEEDDFIDVMLSAVDDKLMRYGHKRETVIKATILSLILAGSDTTSLHITWVVSLLLNNRGVMQRARDEIYSQVGRERWVQESDTNKLVYLQAIVKEALRLYPPGPLSVPHEAMEECSIGGYRVPKGTQVMVNIWKLHRDPRVWSEAEKFMPERFLDFSSGHEFIPFGAGRRSCPGTGLAMHITYLTLARLIQGFYIDDMEDGAVDMGEGMGITLTKATPLEVLITPCLPASMYKLVGDPN